MNRSSLSRNALCLAACVLSSHLLFAASGTWIGGSGNWSDTNNWQDGIVADGANDVATFAPTANISVTVDSARTIGHIRNEGTAQLHIFGPATLTLQDATQPTISNTSSGFTFLKVPLAGAAFAKYGLSARAVMWNNLSHTMTGTIRINEGELRFDSAGETMPGISEVYVSGLDAAARLHYASPADPMSVYPCTFRISGYGTLSAIPAPVNNNGALFIYGDGVNAAVSNIIIDTYNAPVTKIGQVGGSGKLEFRGAISGTAQPQFLVKYGNKTNEFYGSNTYTSTDTHFSMEDTNSHGVFIFHGPQRLPRTLLNCHLMGGSVTLVHLDGVQEFTKLIPSHIGGTVYVKGAPGSMLKLAGDVNNFCYEPYHATKMVISDGGFLLADKYMLVWLGAEIVVSNNGILFCGLEILTGWGGASNTVTIADGGIIDNYLFRASSDGDGTLNLIAGGELRTAGIWTGPDVQPGIINFNGGTLSDGGWGDSGGSLTNWLRGTNLIVNVQAGGAVFHLNGERTIRKSLRHDPALGAALDGGLTKIGAGTLRLAAANTYNGPTIVTNGILAFDTPDALPADSKLLRIDAGAACDVEQLPNAELTIANACTIAGNGTLIGSLNIGNNGAISPGASIGTLHVTSNVTFNSGGLYLWDIGSASVADLTTIEGSLSILAAQNTFTVRVAIASTPDETNTYILASALNGINGSADGIFMDYGTTGIEGPQHPTIDGNNLTVQLIIPEPAALIFCAAALLTLRRSSHYVL